MNRNRLFSLILILLLCVLAACAANVPIPGPDPDEIELDPDVVDIYEGGSGTAMLVIEHSLESIPGFFFEINESFTIYIATHESRIEAVIAGETEGLVDTSMTMPLYGGGSHTTSGQAPVNFEVAGWFYPYPRCEFELEITEYIAYSEATWENTLLGTLPGDFGEDLVTFFEKITLSGPEYSYVFPSSGVLSVSVDTVMLDGNTGCTFLFNN